MFLTKLRNPEKFLKFAQICKVKNNFNFSNNPQMVKNTDEQIIREKDTAAAKANETELQWQAKGHAKTKETSEKLG